MKKVIEISHLEKSFGDIKAVQDLSFIVKEGELFAFLGVNGAGKSTTISILCGHLQKDKGEIKINEKDLEMHLSDVKKDLVVVFQYSGLDQALNVYENLYTRALLYGMSKEQFLHRLEELSNLLDLKPLLKRTLKKLSGGQKRRVDIARAIIHEPKILILDEPTTGLDPQTRKTIWDVIEKLRKEQKMTVLLTTHYMEEASDADYVVIIDSGKIAAEGTPLELKNTYTGDFITLYNVNEEDVKKLQLQYQKIKDAYRLEVKNTAQATELIRKNPQLFFDYEITKGKMDDVFLAVTGKKLVRGEEK